MRAFESFLCVMLLGAYLYQGIRKEKTNRLIIVVMTIVLFVHLIVEGGRWQMGVAYLLVIMEVFMMVHGFSVLMVDESEAGNDTGNKRWQESRVSRNSRSMRRWKNVFAVVGVMMSLILLWAFPVTKMIDPIGPYAVGTTTYDLVDSNRNEIYGHQTGQARKIRIQLWYPTEGGAEGQIGKWIEDGTVVPRRLMEVFSSPQFLMDQSALIDSNSIVDAPIRADMEELPIVIISHGWTGFRNLHSDFGEMLASSGYLAVSIDHTYGSVGLIFEDGQIVKHDPNALPSRDEDDHFILYAKDLVETYSRDSQFVMDHLTRLNSGDFGQASGYDEVLLKSFKDHLEVEALGVIGHSTGGGGVVKFALRDERVKAVVGLDPWVEPIGAAGLEEGLMQEAIFFRSTQWTGGINDSFVKILALNDVKAPRIYEIEGSTHQDFTMMYQFGPLPQLIGISGKLDSMYSGSIQRDFILQFMDQQLRYMETDIDELVDRYDEVFEVFHR